MTTLMTEKRNGTGWIWTVIAALIGGFCGLMLYGVTDRLAVGRTLEEHEMRILALEKQSGDNQATILKQLSELRQVLDQNRSLIQHVEDNQRVVLHKMGLADLNSP